MSDLPIDRSLTELLDQGRWLQQLARTLVRDPHTADDAVQQTWLQALGGRSPVREPRSWLASVLGNVLRQRHRGETRRARREDAVAAATGPTDAAAAAANERFEAQRAVAAAVQALDEPFRTTVLLHHFEGHSLADVARRLQVPAGTVRWRLHRAHELLRQRLRAHWGEDRWRASLWLLCGPRRAAAALPLLAAALLLAGLSWWFVAATATPPAPTAVATANPTAPRDGAAPPDAGAREAVPAAASSGDAPTTPALAAAPAEPRATVRARLVDAQGNPLVGATLRLHELQLGTRQAEAKYLDLVAPPVRSDHAGRVRLALAASAELVALADLPADRAPIGDAQVLASADGCADEIVALRLAPGDDRDLGTITLVASAIVQGRVQAADGTPLGDVAVAVEHPPFPQFCEQVAANQYAPHRGPKTTTTADGTFRIENVRTGQILVWATKPGCISAWALVDLEAPATRCPPLVLRPATAVHHEPWEQTMQVRVVDGDGKPVPEARVHYRLDEGARMRTSGSTMVDRAGRTRLQFERLTPARVENVALTASCANRLLGPVSVQVTPRGDEETVLVLRPGQALVVHAHDERDGSAVREFVAEVAAIPPATGDASARATDGVATLLAPVAPATVTVSATGFAARNVAFVPGQTPGELHVDLAPMRGITGTVTHRGRPVADAAVALLHLDRPVLRNGYRCQGERRGRFDARTDANGRFRIDLETAGALQVLASAPGLATACSERHAFDPAIGWSDVALELTTGGTLVGTVRDADGQPLPRALVAVHDFLGDARTLVTDEAGRYRCEPLRAGPLEVCLADRAITDDSWGWIGMSARDAAETPHGDCEMRDGETVTFDLATHRCRVRGRLVAQGFSPRDWRVQLSRNQRRTTPKPLVLHADGSFELGASSTGEHELQLTAPGGPLGNVTVTLTVDLRAGDNELVVPLTLAPLRGRAVGGNPDAWFALRQTTATRRIEVAVHPDALTLDFAVDLAPVGDVVLEHGTVTGSAELARFTVAPR